MRIKIFGAGSIGNHMAHASRTLGWEVDVCDVNEAALKRMRDEIYPSRYGKWDSSIGLFTNQQAPQKKYDWVIIGTPPESHFPLALQTLKADLTQAILIEKPLCGPSLEGCVELLEISKRKNVRLFVGYDHVVSAATQKFEQCLSSGFLGNIETLDVDWREHWGGIFKAHPWLDGPHDSYLGFSSRGGGALCEHSHGLNMWQHCAHLVSAGRVTEVSALITQGKDRNTDYDALAALHLRCENGLVGRLVQDVVTKPVKKTMRLQGSQGALEWFAHLRPGEDAVIQSGGEQTESFFFKKTRPDDFIAELKHLQHVMEKKTSSPLDIARGLDTMLVIAAAFKSARLQKTIKIDWSLGYQQTALKEVGEIKSV